MKFIKDNGLSLAFFGLFALCFLGQVLTGFSLQFEDPAGQSPAASRWAVFADPGFLKGIFSNWQAALLQLVMLVILTVFLRQKGASHSKKTEEEGGGDEDEGERGWFGRSASWGYRNSLSLAIGGLFVVCFALSIWAEWSSYNADRARLGEASMPLGRFFHSAELWFVTFQTWQAEFFVMGVFLILSVFLRQDGSAESKRVEAGHDETGDVHE